MVMLAYCFAQMRLFKILEGDLAGQGARVGKITLARGEIDTPAFMPVATHATIKAMHSENVAAAGAQIILANMFHLMLRPGEKQIANLGGLHQFMQWPKPILTDSGGYQLYSLAKLRKIREEGVDFRSPFDGAKFFLSPEKSMQVQSALGVDIAMAFDECIGFPAEYRDAQHSMLRSMRWAVRSQQAYGEAGGKTIFGIVQGGMYPDLRRHCAEFLVANDFAGYAIGGVSVGEGQENMLRMIEATIAFLPADKPRYVMGVGKPDDILQAVKRGVDLFDCVLPTRSGRTGQAFTSQGTLNIRNHRFGADAAPLDRACDCSLCRHYSRAYLHHLFKNKEILGAMLLTQHNVRFYQDLMRRIRLAIFAKKLDAFTI